MLNLIKHLAVLPIFISLLACGGGNSDSGSGSDTASDNETPPPIERATSVVAIGDSIGTGFGITTPWPTRLASILSAPVNNNSISGEQTNYGLDIIKSRIDAVNPTHVVILLGTNDAIRGSVSNAISNLQAMVNIAVNNNVTVIVGTLPPITRSSSENQRAAEISAGIRSLDGAIIADVRNALSSGAIADGVHPNGTGQQIIADTFAALF